jgi:AraC-like DNA-binding protein
MVVNVDELIPRNGNGVLRIADSDDLVVVESYKEFSKTNKGQFMIGEHALVLLCTEGMAQFDCDGRTIQLRKGDLFLFLVLNTLVNNFMMSPDFDCRQVWVTRKEAWNINMFGQTSISDLMTLRQHPKVTLSEAEASLMDAHFRLLCREMRESHIYSGIVRSMVGTFLLKALSLVRRDADCDGQVEDTSSLHGKQLVERFMEIVEQSDGRIRRVDTFAQRLNVTPKYLSRLMKDIANRRPSDIILLFTMKAIERRLRFTDMTMQQIAYDLKFANASFFGKYFREHSGMTPMEYRMKYQE